MKNTKNNRPEKTNKGNTKSKKGRALINLLITFSLLLYWYVTTNLSQTIDIYTKYNEIDYKLTKYLNLEDATTLNLLEDDDNIFIFYKNNNKLGLAETTRSKKLFNRFEFTKDLATTSNSINYIVNNNEKSNHSTVIIYGDLYDTLTNKVEIIFNNEVKSITLEDRKNFIASIDFPLSKGNDVELKLLDSSGNEIKKE